MARSLQEDSSRVCVRANSIIEHDSSLINHSSCGLEVSVHISQFSLDYLEGVNRFIKLLPVSSIR
jgi:hypothetical protein